MTGITSTGVRIAFSVLLVLMTGTQASAGSPVGGWPVLPDFGPNVIVFDPSMTTGEIQARVDAIAAQQVDDEMGTRRYSLLFKPGVYGSEAEPLTFQVGYYTEVAGLGAAPTDVTINGHVDVYNRCLTPDNCIALTNFWRSLSNMTINVTGLSGCRSSGNFWAVSQASPMRRVKVVGTLTLMDYCTAGPQYSSGGFISDSQTGFVVNGSQQQFLVRDSSIGGWSNGVWNQVFSGVVGAPPQSFSSTPYNPPPYTTLPSSPVTREKPFLYVNGSGGYEVFVPALRYDSVGTTWANGPTAGESIPIEKFYIATPADTAAKINFQLSKGRHLIFTPGIYKLSRTIDVKHADTVVLGLGLATLVPQNGGTALSVADVEGVKLAGFMIDAGPLRSRTLLRVGTEQPRIVSSLAYSPSGGSTENPTSLHDVFFRIGGPAAGAATRSLVVNSHHTILDHIWAWRADHGNGVGWTVNTADTGVIVNGNDVTAYGLFVEHYQKYQLIWNGENGRTIFFQNEMPYDPPSQAAWSHNGVNGFAAYKVAGFVEKHEAWGMGSYCFFNVGPDIHAARAFEVPKKPGVKLHDLVTVYLNANGGIDHVVNDVGAAVNATNQVSNVVEY